MTALLARAAIWLLHGLRNGLFARKGIAWPSKLPASK